MRNKFFSFFGIGVMVFVAFGIKEFSAFPLLVWLIPSLFSFVSFHSVYWYLS